MKLHNVDIRDFYNRALQAMGLPKKSLGRRNADTQDERHSFPLQCRTFEQHMAAPVEAELNLSLHHRIVVAATLCLRVTVNEMCTKLSLCL